MRVAVLGCGSIGRRHLKNLQTLGQGDLLAHDPAPAVCRQTQDELGVPCSDALADVWGAEPQAVVVASPTAAHAAQALAAVRHGCAVFVEKPLAGTADGLDALLSEAAGRGLVTMTACNMRFQPGPSTVKRLLGGGAIGQVLSARLHTGSYLPRWRPAQDYRQGYSASRGQGGAILDCIHEIDLALWFFGPARLLAAAHRPATTLGLKTDGLAELLLRHEAGTLSSVHLNFVQRDYRRTCEVIGSEGTIRWDFTDGRVDLYGADGALADTFTQPGGWVVNQMYLDEMAHFLDCVRDGVPTINSLAGGLAALEVALAARSPGNGGA